MKSLLEIFFFCILKLNSIHAKSITGELTIVIFNCRDEYLTLMSGLI